jgi:prepilin-type N-terminal cleavage/methylation domain-containing protein
MCLAFLKAITVKHGDINMHDCRSKQAGFSMIEMLVAVVILAVGLLGLAELQITAMRTNSKSGSIVAASTVAQMATEEIMAVKTESNYLYGSMLTVAQLDQDWPDDPKDISPLDGGGVDSDGDGDDDFVVTFSSTPDAAGVGITDIQITVSSLMGGRLATTGASGKVFKDLRRVYSD